MKKPRFKRNVFNVKKLKFWAKQVKRRDKFKCFACGRNGYLHSHHILPKSKFKKYCYDVWNGITLCKSCHVGPNGVHGSKKSRNNIVLTLRELMTKGSKTKVIDFLKLKGINLKYTKYSTYKKPLKRNFKRKLY